MEDVQFPTDYYIFLWPVSDGAEVMFTRGVSLAGEMETEGLLPTAVLPLLTRHPRRVNRYATELVDAGAWARSTSGYQIINWSKYVIPPRERKHIPDKVRFAIYERDGWACVLCGATELLSLDHIFPWSLGGSDDPENLQTLCMPCNMRKGARVS